MDKEIKKRFFENTDDTGRFAVKSLKTGITYYVEPVGTERASGWGDVDPATKKIMSSGYGEKYTGCVPEKESLVTEANGFRNVAEVEGSPMSEIERRDREYERQMAEGTYRRRA